MFKKINNFLTLPIFLISIFSFGIKNINIENIQPKLEVPTINSNAEGNLVFIPNSQGSHSVKFYLDVDDVENQFYNAALEQTNWSVDYRFEIDGDDNTRTDSVTFLPDEMYPDDRFIFKINIDEDIVDNSLLNENSLRIYSLNNFYLGIDGGEVVDKINVDSSIHGDGEGENIIHIGNQYIHYVNQDYLDYERSLLNYNEEETFEPFEILEINEEENYVEFKIWGAPEEETNNNFAKEKIDILLENQDTNSIEIKKANLIEKGRETINDEQREYATYQIDNLGSNDYLFYEIINSLFYVEGSNYYTSNFSFQDDWGIPSNLLDFSITPGENSYVENESFIIEEDSITNSSFRFHLTIFDIDNNFEEEEINLKINNDESGESFEEKAFLISNTGTDYLYEVDGLAHNESYTVYSLNNTGLSVGSSLNEVDNEILIENDLNSNGNFQTTINPYLAYDSFKIDDTTPGSADFTIEILFANGKTQDRLSVGLEGSTKIYTAKLQSVDGDKYTYKIVGLKSNTTYKIETIQNAEFAIDEEENEISNPIYLSEAVSNEDVLEFKTPFDKLLWLLLLIIPIILIFIIWMSYHYHWIRKINKEIKKRKVINKK